MNTTPSSRPALDFDSLLSEFDASGQSAASFARSRGLEPWRIYNALNRRKRNQRRPSSSDLALLPVRLVPDAPTSRAGAQIVLELSCGHRVQIGADFDASLLRRVIEAVSAC